MYNQPAIERKGQYDIFISYRREGGEDKARILNQFLSSMGYNVFFDHEAGINGDFETVILAAVDIAPVFLMLLTPNSLDRCIETGDWVRREIERAQQLRKEIIPINPSYEFKFNNVKNVFKNIESITKLLKTQDAVVDFHTNFTATAKELVQKRIEPFVKPSIVLKETSDFGAKIHFFSDISCRILSYGEQLAVTDANDKVKGAVVRFLKGRHLVEYKSIEHDADVLNTSLEIPDNDYEDYVQIELQPIKDRRLIQEYEIKTEEERSVAEIRSEVENEKQNMDEESKNKYKYDFFFCYSRQDSLVVRQTKKLLSDAGYACWMDVDDIDVGDFFEKTIFGAIDSARCFCFFHSEAINDSEWALSELLYAKKNGLKILVLKLDDSKMTGKLLLELFTLNGFDIRDRNQLNRLLKVVPNILSDK